MAMNLAEDVEDVLIPDALEYYLGLNDDLYDSEGEGDNDEEGGSGVDSDEDEGTDASKKKQSKTKGKGGEKKGGEAAQQQECKQQ